MEDKNNKNNKSNNKKIDADKREFLKKTGLATGAALLGGLSTSAFGASKSMSHGEIIRLNLVDGLAALGSGKVSAQAYTAAAYNQAKKFKDYNIFSQMSTFYAQNTSAAVDKKRNEGKKIGKLQGIPYALKCPVDMVEYYTISGHPSLKTFEPKVDADLVKLYKNSDAVCIGKTQVPPLSLWWTTENSMTGDTGNPFNQAYKTGGSSGGSGAAVAARIVPFAVAEDTGGSVRVPAAMNGIQGFRPTTGRWPTKGTMPIAFSDTLGPVARSVADIKLLDSISANDHPKNKPSQVNLKQIRIGYQKSGFLERLHPWSEENIMLVMDNLSKAGATIVEVKGLPIDEYFGITLTMLLSDFPGAYAHYFARHGVYDKSGLGLMHEYPVDLFKKLWLPGISNGAQGEAYFDLVEKLMSFRKIYNKTMNENQIDVLLYPTSKVPNTINDGAETLVTKGPLGKTLSEFQIGENMLFSPALRTPSISMFSGLDKDGLPLSVTFDGYTGKDRQLLDIAEVIEEKVLPPVQEPKSI